MSILRVKHFFARNNWRAVLILSLCFALLAGSVLSASAYDLTKVRNKSFEKDRNHDGIPNAWSPLSLSAKSKRVCNKAKRGNCSFKMVADGSANYLRQRTRNSSGPAGIIATVSGWMKGKALVGGAGLSGIYMVFNQTDGGTQTCGRARTGGTFGWTKVKNSGCVAVESFTSMTIYMFTSENSGKVWFDKVNLTAVAP